MSFRSPESQGILRPEFSSCEHPSFAGLMMLSTSGFRRAENIFAMHLHKEWLALINSAMLCREAGTLEVWNRLDLLGAVHTCRSGGFCFSASSRMPWLHLLHHGGTGPGAAGHSSMLCLAAARAERYLLRYCALHSHYCTTPLLRLPRHLAIALCANLATALLHARTPRILSCALRRNSHPTLKMS